VTRCPLGLEVLQCPEEPGPRVALVPALVLGLVLELVQLDEELLPAGALVCVVVPTP